MDRIHVYSMKNTADFVGVLPVLVCALSAAPAAEPFVEPLPSAADREARRNPNRCLKSHRILIRMMWTKNYQRKTEKPHKN